MLDMAIGVSLVFHPIWPRLEQYLKIEIAPRDGGTLEDPRVRVGFSDLPEAFGRELVSVTIQCVSCLRPIHPLRRREGDGFDRLYYACSCAVAVRPECSKSRAASLEYQRFKGIRNGKQPPSQLTLGL
jgi:hypothetical protein